MGAPPWLTPGLLLLASCGSSEPPCDEQLVVEDGRSLCARVATGGAALKKGLRGAATLGPNDALVLRYPVPSEACITMEGVDQPLDAWFLDGDRRVIRTACALEAGAKTAVCQRGTSEVLEMAPHGECDAHLGRVLGGGAMPGPVPADPPLGKRCEGATAPVGPIDGRLHLVVHRSELVSSATVEALLQRAQGYYAPYGLWLSVDEVHTLPPTQPATEGLHGGKASDALLTGTRLQLLERLAAEGLPEEATSPDEQAKVDAIVQELVLGPYRELVKRLGADGAPEEGKAPDGRVHVVFLEHIARPGSLGEGLFQELRGLTVSPWLPEGDATRALASTLGLPERFAPVAVVGVEPVDHLGETAVDVTLAHELGHALGLPHVGEGKDLMQEGVHRCVPALRPEQASAMRGHERL